MPPAGAIPHAVGLTRSASGQVRCFAAALLSQLCTSVGAQPAVREAGGVPACVRLLSGSGSPEAEVEAEQAEVGRIHAAAALTRMAAEAESRRQMLRCAGPACGVGCLVTAACGGLRVGP